MTPSLHEVIAFLTSDATVPDTNDLPYYVTALEHALSSAKSKMLLTDTKTPVLSSSSSPIVVPSTPPVRSAKMAHSSRAVPKRRQHEPTLLGIPPELRNTIYRLIMTTQNSQVTVTATGYRRPPVLQTCKEIRSEALSLFYAEHSFTIRARNFDSSAASLWTRRSRHLAPPGSMSCLANAEWSPHWKNLLEWLRKYHAGELNIVAWHLFSDLSSKPQQARDLVSMMFEMTLPLNGSPWGLVEKVLEKVRPLLVETDARWGTNY
ncbi:hypothetical protein TI39_contig350g00031 [Zymoseptoria brevis]|uniref:Uncharacterized protein n=1 Tax=Zymoseptoria brevis TaxID=1047168 RepID=A0A0F4GQZ9_9PEZI|nr:hypothetical protein TI39_contig350g00031 [Zymoseptoria brevis]